jgi:hypothetical protein
MNLTTPKVKELLLSARAAVGNESPQVVDRELLAAFALCGRRGLTDPEMEALIRFVNRIAIDLALLELLENGEAIFVETEDGKLRWSVMGSQQTRHRRPM